MNRKEREKYDLHTGKIKYTPEQIQKKEYMNAFNRYQVERQARLNPLQSLAGVGQTTANALAAGGQAFAGNVNQLAMTNMTNQGNLALTS